MHLDGFEQIDDVQNVFLEDAEMCTGKKKKMMNKQEQEKICVTRVHTIGDCELRSLLILLSL